MNEKPNAPATPAQQEPGPDGIQWKTVGPALFILAASGVIAFLRQDAATGWQDRAKHALVVALVLMIVPMYAGKLLFSWMRINPDRRMFFGIWIVAMAVWWWFVS